jgi:hypothetical protein
MSKPIGIAQGIPHFTRASREAERDAAASDAARKRGKTGRDFEAELDMTHRAYEFAHFGKIWPHSPPFVFARKKWIPRAGGGPVDRTGHVCLEIVGGLAWRGCSIFDETKQRRVVPVAFDVKVLGLEHATYQHEKPRQHQLHQLREAAQAGQGAFLLVQAPKVNRVFMIPIQNHMSDLLSGHGVQLYETRRPERRTKGGAVIESAVIEPLLPSIERSHPFGWDWIPLLKWAQP